MGVNTKHGTGYNGRSHLRKLHVHVACCLSVPHFRCFIRGTRLNSPVFTPAQLCKCSLRAERVTDAVNSSKRRLLSWRLAIPGCWQGSQQRGGVFEFQERGSETWISICYIAIHTEEIYSRSYLENISDD